MNAIDPRADIGHVHLKVADIERALGFYCGVLGFELTQRYGEQAAFVSAGGYHHHLGTNTWATGAPFASSNDARLIDWEVLLPTMEDAGAAARSLISAGHAAEETLSGWSVSDPWGTRLRLVGGGG